jgi:hypothetical protein
LPRRSAAPPQQHEQWHLFGTGSYGVGMPMRRQAVSVASISRDFLMRLRGVEPPRARLADKALNLAVRVSYGRMGLLKRFQVL